MSMDNESSQKPIDLLKAIRPDFFASPFVPSKAASKAVWFTKVDVTDPTGAVVELSVYLHENGGVFAIDSSFLTNGGDYELVDQEDDDSDAIIADPFAFTGEIDPRFKVQLSEFSPLISRNSERCND